MRIYLAAHQRSILHHWTRMTAHQTDLMNDEQCTIYHSLIGALQWCFTLGWFDIAVAVLTMSSFCVAPREGHLDRLKRIYGYLRKHLHFHTGIPPCEEMYTMPDNEWMHTVYGDCANTSISILEYHHVKKCTPCQTMNGCIQSMEIVKRRFLLTFPSLKGNLYA